MNEYDDDDYTELDRIEAEREEREAIAAYDRIQEMAEAVQAMVANVPTCLGSSDNSEQQAKRNAIVRAIPLLAELRTILAGEHPEFCSPRLHDWREDEDGTYCNECHYVKESGT